MNARVTADRVAAEQDMLADAQDAAQRLEDRLVPPLDDGPERLAQAEAHLAAVERNTAELLASPIAGWNAWTARAVRRVTLARATVERLRRGAP